MPSEQMGPLAGSMEWCYDEVKEIDERELMLLAGSILDLFLPKHSPKPSISQIYEVFPRTAHSPVRKMALEKRESQFYAHNRANAKKIFDLGIKQKDLSQHFEPVLVMSRGSMKSSVTRRRFHTDLTGSVEKRELTVSGRDKKHSLKMNDWKLPSSLKYCDH